MKKALLALSSFSVLLIFVVACQKKSTPATPFTYIVNGITDVAVAQADSISIPVQIQTLTGTPEVVTLSLSGVPANVYATITPNTGTPNYNAVIKFKPTSSAAIGAMLITVNSNSASTGTKPYNVNLTIKPASVKGNLIGTWNYTSHENDDNNNSIMDDQVITSGSGESTIFNSDGTGTDMSSGQNTSFTWTLSGTDSTTLNITFSGTTFPYHIDQISNVKLVLKDASHPSIVWSTFTKQ